VRIFLAVLMLFHGVAHLPGLIGSWRLRPLEGVPYHTTVLAGRVDVGDLGMRVLGTGWLLAAVAFAGVSVVALTDRAPWLAAAIVVTVVSLALCVLELPYARVGLVVNLAILAALLLGRRLAWL
jgi:hypothetical protein